MTPCSTFYHQAYCEEGYAACTKWEGGQKYRCVRREGGCRLDRMLQVTTLLGNLLTILPCSCAIHVRYGSGLEPGPDYTNPTGRGVGAS